jgi:hypothetical protein
MAAPSIQIDNQKFLRKMQKYEEIVGKEVGQLVNNAARLCAIECMKYTAPQGKGSDAKNAGEGAVQKDLRNIFTIVNPKWWKEITKGNAFRSGGAAIHDHTGQVWATDTQSQISDTALAKSWHQEHRNSSGRTSRLGLLDRAIIKQATYRKYLRETILRVGIAKAGWAKVASQCNADVREPLRGIPAWVQRNMPKAACLVSDLQSNGGLGFSIHITNKVGYSRETLSDQGESFAVNLAKKKMISMMNHQIRYEKAKLAELS